MGGRRVILVGDAIEQLATLPSGCVRCCVTSPPYWGLRDYGHPGQIGLEETLGEYVEKMVEVFRAVRRVLADDGTLWLNLGDSYVASPNSGTGWDTSTLTKANGRPRQIQLAQRASMRGGRDFGALRPKNVLGVPWRVAFALQDDGWYLRSDIIWAKPNPMPESVRDRPTKSHEYLFLLSKASRYFYDGDAIREPQSSKGCPSTADMPKGDNQERSMRRLGVGRGPRSCVTENGKNARSVWTIATTPYPEAHFATFPIELPARCIKAGSAEGDTVLDPFLGSGTTAAAAAMLGRDWIGCELNPEYAALARAMIGRAAMGTAFRDESKEAEAPLFSEAAK